MKTLIELFNDISKDIDISFPLILRLGTVSSSNWNYTKEDNTIDCEGLTHWPGGANVLSCCHRINPGLHGVNSASLEILNRECGEFPLTDYESANGNYDCCASTKYKGIPMNLSKKEMKSLYLEDYPNKNIVIGLLRNEPEYFEINNIDELMKLISDYNLYDIDRGIPNENMKNWYVFQ